MMKELEALIRSDLAHMYEDLGESAEYLPKGGGSLPLRLRRGKRRRFEHRGRFVEGMRVFLLAETIATPDFGDRIRIGGELWEVAPAELRMDDMETVSAGMEWSLEVISTRLPTYR